MSPLKGKAITNSLFTELQLSLLTEQTDKQTTNVGGPGNKISHCTAGRFITALTERSDPTWDKLHSWALFCRRVMLMHLWNVVTAALHHCLPCTPQTTNVACLSQRCLPTL